LAFTLSFKTGEVRETKRIFKNEKYIINKEIKKI
jgi:hypothetical protein